MKGLSAQIESALDTVIQGLNYDIGLDQTITEYTHFEKFIGWNTTISVKSGQKFKGVVKELTQDSVTITFHVVKNKQRVPTDRKILLTRINHAKVYQEDADLLKDDKMISVINSKVDTFKHAKTMLNKWVNSPNAPHENKISQYVERLVGAGDNALEFLRKALAHDIDYNELDPAKFATAIKAKPILLNAVYELSSDINKLKEDLKVGSFDFIDKEFEIGYPERYAKGQFFPKKDYHKTWYDSDLDAVIIDPKGSKGEMITIDDLNIILPKPPKDKKKILFSEYPKEEQYWRRLEPPKNITPDNVDTYHDYIIEEYRRRREGIWFMNNGTPVYLTGNNYFALQWCQMFDNKGYMDFRYAQLNMFYHLEACIVDKRCFGQIFLKSRRTGFTYIVLSILMNMATSTANGKYGMTSKSGSDVEEVWEKYSYMFQSLPFYFRPIVRGKVDSPKELYFGKPSDNTKETKKSRKIDIEDYLNTVVDHRPTLNGSYDSVKLDGYLGDECVSPDTKVLMSDLTWKQAKNISVGDKLMSGDGTSQEVVKVGWGEDDMYRVVEPYSKDYVVNSKHKLLFEQGNSKDRNKNISITAPEYLKLSEYKKGITRSRKWEGVDYPNKNLPIDPYLLGVWLGDGFSKSTKFIFNHKKDKELLEYVKSYLKSLDNFEFKKIEEGKNWSKYYLADLNSIGNNQHTNKEHRFKKKLKDLKIWGNKKIPRDYFFANKEQRLQLLAGIIDTDGHRPKNKNIYVINMSNKNLIEDIRLLCMTLGFSVSNITRRKSNYNTNTYSLRITPISQSVPTLLKRKQFDVNQVSGRRRLKVDVKHEKFGKYVGFEITPNSLGEHTWIGEGGSLISNCYKWEKPQDYIVHIGMIRPTMVPNGKVVGKAFIGSTMGAMKKGGQQGVDLIKGSFIKDRDPTTKMTPTGLYIHFLPAQDNMEKYTDKYGKCWTEKPPKGTLNIEGEEIKEGSLDYLKAVEAQLEKQGDKFLNEQYRTYPRTMEHAMRDESTECVFNMTKLYEQIQYNNETPEDSRYMIGNFDWKDGIDGDVVFNQRKDGRFKVSWLPSLVDGTQDFANNVKEVNGKFYPLNDNFARFGCDPFSLKSTHGQGSKGGLHGIMVTLPDVGPSNRFVVEYISRPSDERIFFEDVIKCVRYYGSPILVESNRIDLLRHMRNRGYRPFAMDRLDRPKEKLNDNEKEYGGQLMTSKDILDSHMNAIGAWVENYVGVYRDEIRNIRPINEMGDMPFNETLKDWLAFDPTDRTKYDATISSGLAIMACQTEKYRGKKKEKKRTHINQFFKTYSNSGNIGALVTN